MENTFKFIGPRGCGRTTALAEACKKIGAKMVCANYPHARQVESEFGLKALPLSANVKGMTGPFIFDHHAVDQLSIEYEREIDGLKRSNSVFKNQLNSLLERMDNAARLEAEQGRRGNAFMLDYWTRCLNSIVNPANNP